MIERGGHFISDGTLSTAVGLRCADCEQPVRRFEIETCADQSFRIVCPFCGMILICFERRRS